MSVLTSGGFWAFVCVVAGIYTILALGIKLQFGFTGLLNFGQVAFMAIGAYTMAILVVKEGWSMWLAAPLGVGAAIVAGLLLGLSSLRLRADYFAIVTIAFSEIVRYVANNENALTGGSQGTIALGEVGKAAQYNDQWERLQARVQGWLHVSSSDVAMLVIVWSVAVVLLALVWLAVHSPWGRVLRAIREDEDVAASLGKNVFAYKLQVLALGSAFGGIAGLFYAWQFSFFSPADFQPLLTFFAWMIVILGGLGRVWSVPVGSLVFGFLFAGTRFLDFAPLTAIMIVAMSLLDDVPIMTIAYDNTPVSKKPIRWRMPHLLGVAAVLGLFSIAESFGLLLIGIRVLSLEHLQDYFGLTTEAQLQTVMFLQLVAGGHLLLFVTRTERWFLLPPFPAAPLVWAILLTQVVAVLMCAFGWLVAPIPWKLIGWVWAYNLAWTFVLGGVRLIAERFADYRTARQVLSADVVNRSLQPYS